MPSRSLLLLEVQSSDQLTLLHIFSCRSQGLVGYPRRARRYWARWQRYLIRYIRDWALSPHTSALAHRISLFISMLLKYFATLVAAAVGANAAAGSLQQVSNFGSNPTNVGMFVYKPAKLASPPPLIIAMHYCTGTAQAYFSGTQYANLADTHGFIVIYPNAPDSGGCWDVHTNATLTHNAGGDSLGIASMVRYAITNYGVDASRVFATGTSSGAMMTNVLMGAYPDLFAAGSAFSGVPYGCFEGPDLWNSQCATGQLIKTPQQWVSPIPFLTLGL